MLSFRLLLNLKIIAIIYYNSIYYTRIPFYIQSFGLNCCILICSTKESIGTKRVIFYLYHYFLYSYIEAFTYCVVHCFSISDWAQGLKWNWIHISMWYEGIWNLYSTGMLIICFCGTMSYITYICHSNYGQQRKINKV